jgi:hypothetical protein
MTANKNGLSTFPDLLELITLNYFLYYSSIPSKVCGLLTYLDSRTRINSESCPPSRSHQSVGAVFKEGHRFGRCPLSF